MTKKTTIILAGALAVLAIAIAGYYGYARYAGIKAVNTYEECILLGLPQTLIYPPQCTTPDGRTFVDPNASPVVTPSEGIGMANPASEYCIKQGGKLEIISEEPPEAPGGGGGQVGMCTLPGGQVCEEWAFYRGECKE
jgi:putative hemolysin